VDSVDEMTGMERLRETAHTRRTGRKAMKQHHTRYECAADSCLAGTYGMDDLSTDIVLTISRPGWRWDGTRMWCPKHAQEATNVPAS
jgi:hypothetical protein